MKNTIVIVLSAIVTFTIGFILSHNGIMEHPAYFMTLGWCGAYGTATIVNMD